MPSFAASFSDDDRWALSYYILSLSAYKDPLTGEPLPIADADRAALNDLGLEAAAPTSAYVPGGS
jgi:cytochrome c oxidase cbb3-type subunit 2